MKSEVLTQQQKPVKIIRRLYVKNRKNSQNKQQQRFSQPQETYYQKRNFQRSNPRIRIIKLSQNNQQLSQEYNQFRSERYLPNTNPVKDIGNQPIAKIQNIQTEQNKEIEKKSVLDESMISRASFKSVDQIYGLMVKIRDRSSSPCRIKRRIQPFVVNKYEQSKKYDLFDEYHYSNYQPKVVNTEPDLDKVEKQQKINKAIKQRNVIPLHPKILSQQTQPYKKMNPRIISKNIQKKLIQTKQNKTNKNKIVLEKQKDVKKEQKKDQNQQPEGQRKDQSQQPERQRKDQNQQPEGQRKDQKQSLEGQRKDQKQFLEGQKQDQREKPLQKKCQYKDIQINTDDGIYKGQIYNNEMNGIGQLFNKNYKLIYSGGFQDNCFDGFGTLYNLNPDLPTNENNKIYKNFDQLGNRWTHYQGIFKNNKKEEIGELFLTNGDEYYGEFKNNKLNGFGVYKKIDGNQISGYWVDNKLVAEK